MDTLEEKINAWTRESAFGIEIQEVNGKVLQFEQELFKEYEPTRGPHPSFRQRLGGWLENVKDEADQRSLFRLIPYLFFLGPRELEVLYRVAFHTQIARWLIDQISLGFGEDQPEQRLKEAVAHSWFCPITDSMRINAFYHLNHISGRASRPDWCSMNRFGSTTKLEEFIAAQGIERIVLLEDFVGSGEQMEKAVAFAASLNPVLPVLVVPLVICPRGIDTGVALETNYPNVRFSPVIRLQQAVFITSITNANEDPLFAEIRGVAAQMYASLPLDEQQHLYTAFGFAETGSLVVMYTNCPDNTLPLIHHQSTRWLPLFPRASRL